MDVRTLCLGVLSMGDASGYEIRKKLEGPFRYFYDASFGSIYPALNRLQAEGLVTGTALSQEKRPDKKVYSLTTEGRLALVRELSADPAPDRLRSEFIVAMRFAHLLPPRRVAEMIDGRLSELRETVECLERIDRSAAPTLEFLLGYALAVYRAEIAYLDEHRHLVEGAALLRRPAEAAE
jgi:PadR family transcriptional regulator, regulatory protein AphA